MLMPLFGSMVIIANYVINKELITKTFCVNRKKPKLRCNGKCHLMKELRKETQKEKSPLATIKVQLPVNFYEEITSFSFASPSTRTTTFPEFLTGETASATIPVFHPPSYS